MNECKDICTWGFILEVQVQVQVQEYEILQDAEDISA